MTYMLDTNILIYMMKADTGAFSNLKQKIASIDLDQVCMSFITYAELRFGAEASQNVAANKRKVDALARMVRVEYSVDKNLIKNYATVKASLRKAGRPIGENDLWIAAHALAQDLILVSNNTKEFSLVEALMLENWI